MNMVTLEKKLLSRKPTPARPVGLRYDRLPAEPSGPYSLTNAALVSRLLQRCSRVLLACEEERFARELAAPGGEPRSIETPWGESRSRGTRPSEASRGEARSDDGLRREVLRVHLESPGVPDGETSRQSDALTMTVETYAKLPLESESFDGVFVDSSILLSGNVERSLREFKRLLGNGGRLCILVANWEYEMAGRSESYETSFRRYEGDVYLGLVRRTLSPPEEVEYVSLLDPHRGPSRKLARMSRDELAALTLEDVPEATEHILSVELIEIPQITAYVLKAAFEDAGFSNVLVGGAPGKFALKLAGASSPLSHEICESLAYCYPFAGPISDAPHLVAVARA